MKEWTVQVRTDSKHELNPEYFWRLKLDLLQFCFCFLVHVPLCFLSLAGTRSTRFDRPPKRLFILVFPNTVRTWKYLNSRGLHFCFQRKRFGSAPKFLGGYQKQVSEPCKGLFLLTQTAFLGRWRDASEHFWNVLSASLFNTWCLLLSMVSNYLMKISLHWNVLASE